MKQLIVDPKSKGRALIVVTSEMLCLLKKRVLNSKPLHAALMTRYLRPGTGRGTKSVNMFLLIFKGIGIYEQTVD